MMKRVLSLVMCLVMVVGVLPTVTMTASAASNFESASGLVNNTVYTIGAGTDAATTVTADFRDVATYGPNATQDVKYIAIHCTGAYPATSTAKANHNYGKTASNACWHYTVGESIYQLLKDTNKGWHVGTSYTGAPSNSNSIGIEIAVDAFPATETYGGEKWNDGDAIMEWWRTKFNDYMKRAAYLTVVLLKRHDLSKSAIKMHWDSKSYDGGAAGKDCPMQMRATYDPATNTFKRAGEYSDGRNGYFWQMFMGYVDAYYDGATSVGGTTVAPKIGTYRVTSSDGLNVRSQASTSGTLLGALQSNEIVEITELADNGWGKVTMKDGTQGWCAITQYGEYIGVDAQAYTIAPNSSGMTYAYDSDGGLILTNTSTEETGQMDLFTPVDIGTGTTPYMSLQVSPISGNGYFFGLTQKGSGYWMMRDCNSGDQLVEETSAPFMTNMETLEINVSEWWKPADGQRINCVRFYLAPSTSIKINYFYFTATAGKVIDQRYNLRAAASNVNLMQPDNIAVGDPSKKGSWKYSNGMLTVTADTDAGFDVDFFINETFEVAKLTRLLVGIEANTSFNIILTLTNGNGVGTASLAADYCYDFVDTFPADLLIPGPFEGTRGLSMYGYFSDNAGNMPADGMSTISKVTVRLGSKGTTYINAIQLAENDRIMVFRDGIVKEGSNDPSVPQDKVVFESDVYTLHDTAVASGMTASSTVADVLANIRSDYTVTVYENGTAVDGTATAKTGQIIKVTDGTTELASYEMAVMGDINGDGAMTSVDARMIVLSTIDAQVFTAAQELAADYDGNEAVSTADVRLILLALIA